MSHERLIQKIRNAGAREKENRRDPRFRRVMAFMVHKGFLRENSNFDFKHLGKIRVKDTVWAGKNVEPRILERFLMQKNLDESFSFGRTNKAGEPETIDEDLSLQSIYDRQNSAAEAKNRAFRSRDH